MLQRAGHASTCPETGGPRCLPECCLLHSTLGHTSGAVLCHLILTHLQETLLAVSCGDWRQRQAGLCQRSAASHTGRSVQGARAAWRCQSTPAWQILCSVTGMLQGEKPAPSLLCLLSSFCEHLWNLDRAGTHTESSPSFLAVWMKVVSAP